MRTLIILTVVAFFTTSCKEDSLSGVNLDVAIGLSILSEEGLDRLNPLTPNHLTKDDIVLYEEQEGVLVEYTTKANLDYPKGFFIFESTPYYRIKILPRLKESEDFPRIFIKWGDLGMDTLRLEIVRKNNNASTVAERVWFNDEKVYDQDEKYEERYFIITR